MNDIERLQSDVTDFLLSQDELRHVSITQVRPKSGGDAKLIATNLAQTLGGLEKRNGKAGLSAIVTMPEVVGVEPNVPAVKGGLRISVNVIENVMVNMGGGGTGMTAEECAMEVASLMQHQTFKPWSPMVADPNLITPKPESVLAGKVEYVVTFQVAFTARRKDKVLTPKHSQAGNEITLTCGTEDAEMWWTADGSFPGPGNDQANRYGGPFGLPVGTHCMRYAAYRCGWAGSIVEQAAVTVV